MAIKYRHQESTILTSAQRTKFITFVSGVWPGATADVDSVSVSREPNESGYSLISTLTGTMTVATIGELPSPPFRLVERGSDYTYRHSVSTTLTSGQETNLVDFVQDTWSGAAADVTRIEFVRSGASDIKATFFGTKTAATVGDLPTGAVTILEVT